ncbi:hypothetical protein HQ590_01005 [bacterium]|nr:hypothetical protein [bacterium]
MIAILVAVKQELRPILRRSRASEIVRQTHLDFHEGTLAAQPVALLALGIGKECARIAAEITIRCYRPDLLISAGFGGSLMPEVCRGDIVVGTEILELQADRGDELHWTSAHRPVNPPRVEPDGHGFRVHFGKLLTAEEMVLRSATKKRLGRETGALSVDMETSAVATVAARAETEFLAVRCITDGVTDSLPEDYNDFFVLGQLRPRRVLGSCARHPLLVADLARLGYYARVAGRNLARFLEVTLPKLPLPVRPTKEL